MEAEVGFPVLDGFRREKRVHFLDELGLVDVQNVDGGILQVVVVSVPVKVGGELESSATFILCTSLCGSRRSTRVSEAWQSRFRDA